MDTHLELGLDTFGDVGLTAGGRPLPQARVIRDVVTEAVLADELGVDFIGIGEHHRADFAVSSPEMVLAAIAGQTRRIRLGSAVTVLSSDDPVRVFQRFATLDAVSNGRAEVILGRGSFTESFPLFGYQLEQYELLFEEKLALFAALLDADRTGEPVGWQGRTRAARRATRLPENGARPADDVDRRRREPRVGGARRALRHATDARDHRRHPRRFVPYVELYHRALAERGAEPLPVGVHSPGHVAETDAGAREEFWPAYRDMRNRIGAERGWGPTSYAEFVREIEGGSLYVGAPETVARKIAATARMLRLARFDLKYSAGSLAHETMMRGIELYGREVIPLVRKLLAVPDDVSAR